MKLTEADQEKEKKQMEGQVESRNRNSLNSAVRRLSHSERLGYSELQFQHAGTQRNALKLTFLKRIPGRRTLTRRDQAQQKEQRAVYRGLRTECPCEPLGNPDTLHDVHPQFLPPAGQQREGGCQQEICHLCAAAHRE
jgi:hypothetical protein